MSRIGAFLKKNLERSFRHTKSDGKSSYSSAITAAVVQQFGLFCLTIMITSDGPSLFCMMAMAAHWGGIVLIRLRRPVPTQVDLAFIRAGFMVIFLITIFLSLGIWSLQGKM